MIVYVVTGWRNSATGMTLVFHADDLALILNTTYEWSPEHTRSDSGPQSQKPQAPY